MLRHLHPIWVIRRQLLGDSNMPNGEQTQGGVRGPVVMMAAVVGGAIGGAIGGYLGAQAGDGDDNASSTSMQQEQTQSQVANPPA
jgi:hypothetical protein